MHTVEVRLPELLAASLPNAAVAEDNNLVLERCVVDIDSRVGCTAVGAGCFGR